MWISKEDYEKLKQEISDLKQENQTIEIKEHNYYLSYLQAREDIEQLQMINEKTLTMLRHVIDITFENNKCFETVVFQRFDQTPEIFVRGKKMAVNSEDEVVVKFKSGNATVTKKETI